MTTSLGRRKGTDRKLRRLLLKDRKTMKQIAINAAADVDRFLMRIMTVLLSAALESYEVDALSRSTGYPKKFIQYIFVRAKKNSLELDPTGWTSDGPSG